MSLNTEIKLPEVVVIITPPGDLQITDYSKSRKHLLQLKQHLSNLGIEITSTKKGWCG